MFHGTKYSSHRHSFLIRTNLEITKYLRVESKSKQQDIIPRTEQLWHHLLIGFSSDTWPNLPRASMPGRMPLRRLTSAVTQTC
ncbi:hypothetical protein RUM43_008253 [Polyplax serrata]|uniref:Uncharacterized protein n=1 Tax=Polyplax serrata TaxID=468196 RepID=A0AAN8SAC0_POLSC